MLVSWYHAQATFNKKESRNRCNHITIISCIVLRRLWISIHKLYSNKELVILTIIFTYFAVIGMTLLMPHITDTIHMKLALHEQLHLFLLNAGWVTPIIRDMTPFSHYSVVLLGMVKDAEKTLPDLLLELNILACSYKYAHFFVLESNSNDNTRQIIKDWGMQTVDCDELDLNKNGIVDKHIFQPHKEFADIAHIMKLHKSINPNTVREERYVVYRNYLLDKVKEWYDNQKEIKIDYLLWIDMDLRGFDISEIANEFSVGWELGYDVLCTNGVKYGGWYYDSYATVAGDGVWLHGIDRWNISNEIRKYRFYDVRSCFGGLAAYNFEFLLRSQCKYEHFASAYAKNIEFAQFSDAYNLYKICEHLPLNFCLRQNDAKLAVATRAHSFYGTADQHG